MPVGTSGDFVYRVILPHPKVCVLFSESFLTSRGYIPLQNTSGLPVGGVVRYALNKVKGNQETQIKAGTADRATGKIILEKLEWNTPYKNHGRYYLYQSVFE